MHTQLIEHHGPPTWNNHSSVGLNAAFLQEVKEDSIKSDQLINLLGLQLSREEKLRSDWSKVSRRLRALRDAWAMQFALEEAYGYIENPKDFPAAWAADAEVLRMQHRLLFKELLELIDCLESVLTSERELFRAKKRIKAGFQSLSDNYRIHEIGEQQLIDAVAWWQRSAPNLVIETHVVFTPLNESVHA